MRRGGCKGGLGCRPEKFVHHDAVLASVPRFALWRLGTACRSPSLRSGLRTRHCPDGCRYLVLEEEVLMIVLKASQFYHQWRAHNQMKPNAGAGGTDKELQAFGQPACRPEISVTHVDTPGDAPACEAAGVHRSRQRYRLTSR